MLQCTAPLLWATFFENTCSTKSPRVHELAVELAVSILHAVRGAWSAMFSNHLRNFVSGSLAFALAWTFGVLYFPVRVCVFFSLPSRPSCRKQLVSNHSKPLQEQTLRLNGFTVRPRAVLVFARCLGVGRFVPQTGLDFSFCFSSTRLACTCRRPLRTTSVRMVSSRYRARTHVFNASALASTLGGP